MEHQNCLVFLSRPGMGGGNVHWEDGKEKDAYGHIKKEAEETAVL